MRHSYSIFIKKEAGKGSKATAIIFLLRLMSLKVSYTSMRGSDETLEETNRDSVKNKEKKENVSFLFERNPFGLDD